MRSSIVVVGTGGPTELEWRHQPTPVPGRGEILLRADFCALNYPDLLMTRGRYQLRPSLPFILGSEVVGTVVDRGADVTELRVGQHVHALLWYGAFTTYLVLDASTFRARPTAMQDVITRETSGTILRAPLALVPDDVDPRRVAAAGFAGSTAYHALKERGRLARGESVLVLGATGGVGSALTQVAKLMGASELGGTYRTESERQALEKANVLPIHCEELLNDARRRALPRFDLVCDTLGGPYANAAVRCLATGGRVLVLGFVAESSPGVTSLQSNHILLREASVHGVAWGAWAARHPQEHLANWRDLIRWLREGTVSASVDDSQTWPLERAADALAAMESGKLIGKALLRAH